MLGILPELRTSAEAPDFVISKATAALCPFRVRALSVSHFLVMPAPARSHPRRNRVRRPVRQPSRNASSGCTRAALLAGIQLATSTASTSTTTMPANVAGSDVLTS